MFTCSNFCAYLTSINYWRHRLGTKNVARELKKITEGRVRDGLLPVLEPADNMALDNEDIDSGRGRRRISQYNNIIILNYAHTLQLSELNILCANVDR